MVGAAVEDFLVVGLGGQQVFHLVNEIVQRVLDGYHGMPPAGYGAGSLTVWGGQWQAEGRYPLTPTLSHKGRGRYER